VPVSAPLKFTAAVVAPLHSVWLTTVLTPGVGFTVISKVFALPVQPLADGVTVIVAFTGAVVVLAAVKAAMSPAPLAARPIEVVLFVQL
jgi:hypothetical protein